MDTILSRRGMGAVVAAFGLAVMLTATPSLATDLEGPLKLTASNRDTDDFFGLSVAADGNVAVIGAPTDDDVALDSGAAYIYRFVGSSWVETDKLKKPDTEFADLFGYEVAVHGDVAMIAALGHRVDGVLASSVYVYRFDGFTWTNEQRLAASDTAPDNTFGSSISIDGDVAVIGASGDDENGPFSGAAYVFRFNGSSWVEEQKLTASDGMVDEAFGRQVVVQGDRALVTAIGDRDQDGGFAAGSAYAFRFDGSTWIEEQKLTALDAQASDQFGDSLALDGDTAVIGTYIKDNRGAAYVFRFDGSAWGFQSKLTASDSTLGDHFARSVAVRGDRILIGASRTDVNGTDSGSTYVFRASGNAWVESQKLLAPDGADFDQFGVDVALVEGDLALIAAEGDDANRGAAYSFVGLDCFEGTVNAGNGSVFNVLFVDGSAGGPDRTVEITESDLLHVTLVKPGAGGTGRFVLHGNSGEPTLLTQALVPFDIGVSCFTFLGGQGSLPTIVANNIGKTNVVGESRFYATPWDDPDPATTSFVYPDLPVGTVMTFQAVILDPGAVSSRGASTTNAVVVRVVP